MCLTEFDEKAYLAMIREEGREEGCAEKQAEFEKALSLFRDGERDADVYRKEGISDPVIKVVLK